jgi:hypothetical protein
MSTKDDQKDDQKDAAKGLAFLFLWGVFGVIGGLLAFGYYGDLQSTCLGIGMGLVAWIVLQAFR